MVDASIGVDAVDAGIGRVADYGNPCNPMCARIPCLYIFCGVPNGRCLPISVRVTCACKMPDN